MNNRLFWSSVALCLPTTALVVAAFLFYCYDVPRIQQSENERVRSEAREIADDLKDGAASADFVWEYGKGVVDGREPYASEFMPSLTWKDWPSNGPKRKTDMWGFMQRGSGILVWVRSGRKVLGRETALAAVDYESLFFYGGLFSCAILIAITCIAIRYFRSYVKSRDDYLAATAHDLTTPLVGMRFCIGRDDEEAKVLNERLIRIVDNIKDFLRMGGRRTKANIETFDVVDAYKEAYRLFKADYRDILDGRDVPLEVVGDAKVSADMTLVVQILWNLLGNDLKYAAPFGPVRVRIRREMASVAVEFIDEGQGMTPSQMRHAFDRYYRAKTVLECGKGGFGLGLCTAREQAKLMRGSLTVRANAPSGCVFTLRLPAAQTA